VHPTTAEELVLLREVSRRVPAECRVCLLPDA